MNKHPYKIITAHIGSPGKRPARVGPENNTAESLDNAKHLQLWNVSGDDYLPEGTKVRAAIIVRACQPLSPARNQPHIYSCVRMFFWQLSLLLRIFHQQLDVEVNGRYKPAQEFKKA